MDGGNLDDVKELLVKLAVIASRLDARSAAAVDRIEAGAGALELGAQHWQASADAFSRQALLAIASGARETIAGSVDRAMAPIEARLKRGSDAAEWAADALAEQRKLLTQAQRGILRGGLLAWLAGSLLAAGASGFLAWHTVRAAGLQDALQRAVSAGALMRCPDRPSLCARITARTRRAGPHGEYLVIDP